MKLTKGIHHVAIAAKGVTHYKEVLKFYTEILGMEAVRSWGTEECPSTMLDIGGGSMMEIFSNGKDASGDAALLHLAFDVESTDKCAQAVEKAGYKITIPPQDITINADNPVSARIAFCIGPVGEIIEFFETK